MKSVNDYVTNGAALWFCLSYCTVIKSEFPRSRSEVEDSMLVVLSFFFFSVLLSFIFSLVACGRLQWYTRLFSSACKKHRFSSLQSFSIKTADSIQTFSNRPIPFESNGISKLRRLVRVEASKMYYCGTYSGRRQTTGWSVCAIDCVSELWRDKYHRQKNRIILPG